MSGYRRILTAAVAALVLALGLPTAGWAQTQSAITGSVKDNTNAVLPGVTLTLSSPNMVGGTRTTETGAGGTYRFSDLPPGVYEVEVALQGFQSNKRTGLQVAFGTTLTIDVVLQIGSISETVTVNGASPVVDVKSAASTTKVDDALLQNLPTSGRSARPNEIFSLAPGVTTYRTAHGGTRDANNMLVDGLSTSSLGNTRTSVMNYNWMQEVQVVSLGANAEYGEFTGTVANMIMRSGSNKLSGLVDYTTTRQNWLADNTVGLTDTLRARFTPATILTQYDASAQVGGPIKKDKLFFFAGGEYYRNDSTVAGALPGPDGRAIPSKEHWTRYITKLNWAATPQVKVEGFVEHDNDSIDGGTSVLLASTAVLNSRLPKTMWNERLTWTINNKTLVEVRNGGIRFSSSFGPAPPNTTAGPYPHRDTVTGITTVNNNAVLTSDSSRDTVGVSLTSYLDNVVGKSHELKVGLEYERSRSVNFAGIPGGRLYSDVKGIPDQVTLFDGTTTDAIGTRLTAYVQDSWTLNNRLTIQPGVRFSANRGSIPAMSGVYAVNPASPRLGFAWDVQSNHKTLVRGQWGWFHETPAVSLYQFLDFSHWSPSITAKVLGPDTFQERTRSVMPGNLAISPDLNQAYVNQFVLALEHELFTDFSVTAQYVRRHFNDLFAFVDTGSQWAPVQAQDPGPDGVAGTADDGALLTVYSLLNPGQSYLVFSNPSEATRRYNAFMLIAKKRFSHNWQMQLSYTRSKSEGQVNTAINENLGGGTDTGQTGEWTNPNAKINAYGPGQYDSPNQFAFSGTYRVPYLGGFNLSANYRYATGVPYGRLAVIRGLKQGNQTVRVEARGTHTADALNQFDLRFEKTIPVGSRARNIGVYLDLFNVTNSGKATAYSETSGGTYGVPSSWSGARSLQAGLRFTF